MREVAERRFFEDFGRLEIRMEQLHQQGTINQEDYDDFLRMKQRIISQSLDLLTQLLARTSWYVEFRESLLDIYPGLNDLDGFSKDEVRRYLKKMVSGKNRVSVLAGDMSFLGVSNEHGQHWQGDTLIGGVGKSLNEIFGKIGQLILISRHGGDEFFTFSIDVSNKTILVLINEFLDAIQNIDVPNLRKYGLNPNMDFGSAEFFEGCDVLLTALENDIEIDKTYFKFLVDTAIVIADIRSSVNKSLNRIPLLMLLREQLDRETYQHLKPALAKGGGGISEDELDNLALLFHEDIGLYQQCLMKFVLDGVRNGKKGRSDAIIIDKALELWERVPWWRRMLDAF